MFPLYPDGRVKTPCALSIDGVPVEPAPGVFMTLHSIDLYSLITVVASAVKY